MAKQQKKVERVSATLSTGTKVTASQEVIDKVQRKAKAEASSTSSKSSK
ncbi:MAG TPA: hypothetical protein VFJ19_10070 [Nocardioidaceae bacterium]|nr:hypothetical protein [Nocardioidaceae bacterium]